MPRREELYVGDKPLPFLVLGLTEHERVFIVAALRLWERVRQSDRKVIRIPGELRDYMQGVALLWQTKPYKQLTDKEIYSLCLKLMGDSSRV